MLDSVGVGELPDAGAYADEGSNTLRNISRVVPLKIPGLRSLGLDRIVDIGNRSAEVPAGAYGRMAERSPGKDSVTGHWEIAGLVLDRAFPTFPDGFPRSSDSSAASGAGSSPNSSVATTVTRSR